MEAGPTDETSRGGSSSTRKSCSELPDSVTETHQGAIYSCRSPCRRLGDCTTPRLLLLSTVPLGKQLQCRENLRREKTHSPTSRSMLQLSEERTCSTTVPFQEQMHSLPWSASQQHMSRGRVRTCTEYRRTGKTPAIRWDESQCPSLSTSCYLPVDQFKPRNPTSDCPGCGVQPR